MLKGLNDTFLNNNNTTASQCVIYHKVPVTALLFEKRGKRSGDEWRLT